MARLVVHVEWRPDLDPDVTSEQSDEQWGELLAPLFDRAGALGGRVIGWSGRSLTVDFAWDGLYDAVDFLVDAPLAPEFASGLCHGDSDVIFDVGRVAVAIGPPVRLAQQLATLARPGEVLVDPSLAELTSHRLCTAREIAPRPGRPSIPALLLNPDTPLLETTVPEAPGAAEGFSVGDAVQRCASPSSQAPHSERERHVDRLLDTADAIGSEPAGVFPPELSSALRKRDAESLHELAATVRAHDAVAAADRIDAIAALASGKSGEALRRLRRSKTDAMADDASARCRSALALAVALASAGRPYEAALEGLDGVARAREGGDERGERACARFLSQLSRSLNDTTSSEAWGILGQ